MKKRGNLLLVSCLMVFSLFIIADQGVASVIMVHPGVPGSNCDVFKHDTGVCGKVRFPEMETSTGVRIECPSSCSGELTAICINGEITAIEGACSVPPIYATALTEPPLGRPITSSPVVFKWSASQSPKVHYSLAVGTSPGASDILKIKRTKKTETRPIEIPIDGSIIYVRLEATDMFGQTVGFFTQYQTLTIIPYYPVCNNGLCQGGETCDSCPEDCGECLLPGEEADPTNEITIGEFILLSN